MKRHRWIMIATYNVTADALEANRRDPKAHPIIMDHEALISVDTGCLDCEVPWTPGINRARCSAAPYDLKPDKFAVTGMGYGERLDRKD